MASIIGSSAPFASTRALLFRTVNPALTQVFYSYTNTQTDQTVNKVKISPEFRKLYAEKRTKQKQGRLGGLRDRVILDGLPKPGDRFYSASWEMLAQEHKSKP